MNMTTSEFAIMVLTQAVGFLFNEAKNILTERRERRQKMGESDDTVALATDIKESTKEDVLKLSPVNFDEEVQKEIDHLLKLIEIQRNYRRKAEVKINARGGILFVPPDVGFELENAENELLKLTQRLKKLLEKVYNQPIHVDGLE